MSLLVTVHKWRQTVYHWENNFFFHMVGHYMVIRMTGIGPHIARWLNLKWKLNEKKLIELG